MKGVFRNHALASAPTERPGALPPSPEHRASATSGSYFRAVRPTAAEAATLADGEPVIDSEKVERLRSTVEAMMWRPDVESIAERMLDDAS
jgi:anti-sigma28 factor (negative regulator of flagellin synthesis)